MMARAAYIWRIIPVSKWLVTPIYKPFRPLVRGPTTRSLGDLRSPWLLTTYHHPLGSPILQAGSNLHESFKTNISALLYVTVLSRSWTENLASGGGSWTSLGAVFAGFLVRSSWNHLSHEKNHPTFH